MSLYCSGTSYDKLEIHSTDEEEHAYGYYEGIVEKQGVGQYQYEQHNTDGEDDCSEEENDDSDEASRINPLYVDVNAVHCNAYTCWLWRNS